MILADLASQGVTPATRTVGTGGRRNPATGAAQFSVAGGCDPGLGECINDRLIPDGYKPGAPPPGPNYTFTYDRGGNPLNPGSAPVGVSAGNRNPPRHGGGGFLIGSAAADDGSGISQIDDIDHTLSKLTDDQLTNYRSYLQSQVDRVDDTFATFGALTGASSLGRFIAGRASPAGPALNAATAFLGTSAGLIGAYQYGANDMIGRIDKELELRNLKAE